MVDESGGGLLIAARLGALEAENWYFEYGLPNKILVAITYQR
jgi:hypothetical protein